MSENSNIPERTNPLTPHILVGTYVNCIHTDPSYIGPKEIKQSQTSPLVQFLANKSYEKRDKKKGPVCEPLPLI
ncbi:hypothetical protein TVAG_419380 [Trichomonas vaginalis G3]|uniref:Uncharacterized protein n=1 Tax=Trichomonas vaginalis (strain ATCC PRA-98 / G3) TaxID=412133 RepID=A2FSI3_TRIV3|nr:hypothetical protein TVAGG3_0315440 [Trichomonas vaginalis G3]EAX92133.1 hypothetical protein TVAG_419380 [Trichomonas vaginalis G3]KAI5528920.1 hypothetical protein TVAGG3_0315440 [Trichomonas vaginalis G3]|eukprot:XP_001305063.1 hypothetical protein [Trichomonas vaginalis G3]